MISRSCAVAQVRLIPVHALRQPVQCAQLKPTVLDAPRPSAFPLAVWQPVHCISAAFPELIPELIFSKIFAPLEMLGATRLARKANTWETNCSKSDELSCATPFRKSLRETWERISMVVTS